MKIYFIMIITCFSPMTYPMLHLQRGYLNSQKRTCNSAQQQLSHVQLQGAVNRIKKSEQWKNYKKTAGDIIFDQYLMIKIVSSQRKKNNCACPLQTSKEWPGNWQYCTFPGIRGYLNPVLCTCLQKLNYTREGHSEKIDLLKEQQKDLEALLVNELGTTPDNKLNYLDYIFTCLKDPECVKYKLRLKEEVALEEDPYESTNGE